MLHIIGIKWISEIQSFRAIISLFAYMVQHYENFTTCNVGFLKRSYSCHTVHTGFCLFLFLSCTTGSGMRINWCCITYSTA